MSTKDKVLWSDGVFLRPQHFQQQERFLLNQINSRTIASAPHSWGVCVIEVDQAKLELGFFALQSINAVFQDGSHVDSSSGSPLPEALKATKDDIGKTICLCVYLSAAENGLVKEVLHGSGKNELYRYQSSTEDVLDVVSNHSPKTETIETARLSCTLKVDNGNLSGYSTIPIAKIESINENSQLVLHQGFLPTALTLLASKRLSMICEEVHALLVHRSVALSGGLGTTSGTSVADVADFFLLLICNRYQPLLEHFNNSSTVHPERLYEIFIQLYAEVSTISSAERRPSEVPRYDHRDLQSSFEVLVSMLKKSLNWIPQSKAKSIPLTDHGHGIQTATIDDTFLISSSSFVIAVSADVPTETLVSLFPRQTTIATVDTLKNYVRSQTSGITVSLMPVAPRQLPFHEGYIYFELDATNVLWKDVATSSTLALHFSGTLSGLNLQLWAVSKES